MPRLSTIKAEPRESKGAVATNLTRDEWYLNPTRCGIQDWVLLTMLNYEYARCYQPLLKMVAMLGISNSSGTPQNDPMRAFACFLAQYYPEFPGTPWAKIALSNRKKRLARFVNIKRDSPVYLQGPAWEAWKFIDSEIIEQQENFDPTADHPDFYGIFKLDFSQQDEVICEQFAHWLSVRRAQLLEKYDKKIECGGRWTDRNEIFLPKKLPSGRGHKKRKCQDFLKALGGLRALKYHGDKWEKAEENTAIDADHSLYNGRRNAAALVRRLEGVWQALRYFRTHVRQSPVCSTGTAPSDSNFRWHFRKRRALHPRILK
jgi:hypothetical protein